MEKLGIKNGVRSGWELGGRVLSWPQSFWCPATNLFSGLPNSTLGASGSR